MDADSRKITFISISLTLFTVAIVYYSFYTGRDIAERYTPLVAATMNIKLETTKAHLWFEEAISGDQTIDIVDIWGNLEQAKWYAQAMLDGGTNKGDILLALNSPYLRGQIEETIQGINDFRQIAERRWASKSISGIGSDIDQQFDLAFVKFNTSADNVENALKQLIVTELQKFELTQHFLLALILILGVGIAGLLLRYNNTQTKTKLTLQASEELWSFALEGSGDGVWDLNVQTNGAKYNKRWKEMLGYTKGEISPTHQEWLDRIHPEDREDVNENMQAYLAGSIPTYVITYRLRCKDDSYKWILTRGMIVSHDAQKTPLRMIGTNTDITLMKEHQNELERIANYDILTNLPNRVLLADRISQAMLQCNRRSKSLAVVFLDVDGFKYINDSYGHALGDQLLIALSSRMKKALRDSDTLSRIGGDEFISVLTDLTTVADCEPILERLLLAVSDPITVNNVIINVSASIGITLYPQDSVDTDQLIRHADQAMYVAKQSGKNQYHLFDTAQDDAVKLQRENLEAIRRALDKQEFVLYYQPKVNMRTGKVIGVEALIRWQNPEKGLLNPIEFLPAIENNPMNIEMGEWVIDTALRQISQWQKMDLGLPVSISVNISAVQLQQTNFVARLTTLLAAHPDVEPHCLELEVLETSALDDVDFVSVIMSACMKLGVKFALDDFGTGYSSLTYLRRLPANLIKIDQSFVRDMLSDADDFAIVEGVIALSKSFKRDVIAEGVETIEHSTALLQMGCHLAQGYGIAKPMPANDIPTWIGDWKAPISWQI